jgi:hypothetical protein
VDITNGSTLSSAVKDTSTPLSKYLRGKFPNAKPLQHEYKASGGSLIIDTQGAPAGTVGTATDLMVRFLLDPDDVPQSSRIHFAWNANYIATVDELIHVAAHPTAPEDGRQDRAVWALALCVEAYRAGGGFPSIVDQLVLAGEFDVDTALALAPESALAELPALRAIAKQRLIPRLKRPFYLGPEFDSSKRGEGRLIAAEADVICNGLLLDIKTHLGVKNSAGVRTNTLIPHQLHQLLAYALLDRSDTYAIDRLGLYSARYGRLAVWPLEYVATTMAGQPIDFAVARQEMWDMLHA